MKTILSTLLLLAVFCGCASAEPPDHKPLTMTLVAPVGAPITGVNCYGANHADVKWTLVKSMNTTNGQYMAAPVPPYEIYTATSTNVQTGEESDYAPKVAPGTNGVLVIPVVSIK